MPNVPVVAVPVSLLKCESCQRPLEGFLERHVCPHCGKPQKLSGEDYFSVLGVEKRFAQDRAHLERNFYAASRVLHPDRFTTSDPEAQRDSLERMSFLNEAYRTLRNPGELRLFILKREGVLTQPTTSQSIPAELAEDWFDLQDELSKSKLEEFELKLRTFKESTGERIQRIEETLDQHFEASGLPTPRELLQEMLKLIHIQAYLKSIERDVERLKARVH